MSDAQKEVRRFVLFLGVLMALVHESKPGRIPLSAVRPLTS